MEYAAHSELSCRERETRRHRFSKLRFVSTDLHPDCAIDCTLDTRSLVFTENVHGISIPLKVFVLQLCIFTIATIKE